MPEKKFFIAAPLYAAASRPHLGHAFPSVVSDALARHLRAEEVPVLHLGGLGERCAEAEEAAAGRGAEPADWCARVAADYEQLWRILDVRFDSLAVAGPGHAAGLQAAYARLEESGDIYTGRLPGHFCEACGAYYAEEDLDSGKCPVHLSRPEKPGTAPLFRLSKYSGALLEHYANNPGALQPRERSLELAALVRAGLKDIPVARRGAWGVPVKSSPGFVVRGWFDRLLLYAAAAGAWEGEPGGPWPPDALLAGRDGLLVHGAAWPAALLALGLQPPLKTFSHGLWTAGGRKMSSAAGNFTRAEDLARDYGTDAVRYYLLRAKPPEADAEFSAEALRARYDSELAGGLGHLFERVTNLAGQYPENRLPHRPEGSAVFSELSSRTPALQRAAGELRFSAVLDGVWDAVALLNRIIDERKPLGLARRDPAALREFLREMVWCLRLLAGWLNPYMPDTASRMQLQLGVGAPGSRRPPPLFPRLPGARPGDASIN